MSTDVRPQPVLFGSEQLQALLLEIARTGEVRVPRSYRGYYLRLVKIGICRVRPDGSCDVLTLDERHPAISEICDVLGELSGVTVVVPGSGAEGGFAHPQMPLGHRHETPFRVMLTLAQAEDPLDEVTIQRRLGDKWPSGVELHLKQLVSQGVVDVLGEGRFALSPQLPRSFKALLLRLADVIGDPRLQPRTEEGPRAWAYRQAADAAPRLFGTDIRFRNLMALAVHGPMMRRDLRRLIGVGHGQKEGADYAPYGRGDVVRTWMTPHGPALGIDEEHPLHLPLPPPRPSRRSVSPTTARPII